MFSRILFSTIAAAILVGAAPALAAEDATRKSPCTCCSDGSVHETDHRLREAERKRASERAADEDPFVRNQSWGG